MQLGIDDIPAQAQVMAWCHQARRHHLDQCWQRCMALLGQNKLTLWGWNKLAAIWQTTFSNAFSWTKMCECWLKFCWILSLRVQFTICQHWFRKWLAVNQVTSPYLNQSRLSGLVYWCRYTCIYIYKCIARPQFNILTTSLDHFSQIV